MPSIQNKSFINKFGKKLLEFLNTILPKKEQVIISGFPNAESSAIEVANYIQANLNIPVFYVVSSLQIDSPKGILSPGITLVNSSGNFISQAAYFYKIFSSKYIFMTHGLPLESFPSSQIVVNIWHGIFYKKLGKLIGGRPIITDVTVGTSNLTKKMFSEAFGVTEESVFVSGYPRNDILYKAKQDKVKIKEKLGKEISSYKKIIIWLPTFRKTPYGNKRQDGSEIGNPFYIKDFDVERFNNLLEEENTLCIVKPHPLAVKYEQQEKFNNLLFIDDKWISDKGITLYHLVGCTDILISDVSSIVIDYLLMDNPIICISTDFEIYKISRGFYFEDIENWLPNLITNEELFIDYLQQLLKTNYDPYAEKRRKLKDVFFKYQDGNSTKRLIEYVFKLKNG